MIQEKIEEEILVEKKLELIRYGWGNTNLKTWFLTKNKKSVLPKSSKLLFIIYGLKSNNTINVKNTFPTVGDICKDINGITIKITKIEWK